MTKKAHLTAAKKSKNDEFYTQWADIEREINALKWSRKSGQVAKVYPIDLKGYEHGETPEFFGHV